MTHLIRNIFCMKLPYHIGLQTLLNVAIISALPLDLTKAEPVIVGENVIEAVIAEEDEVIPAGRIFLKNGDKLRGRALNLDEDQKLHFESNKFKNTASFPIDQIIAIKLDKNITPNPIKTLARVELNNRYNKPYGDILLGTLKELTPESLVLETAYAGLLTVRRSMVKSFEVISQEPGFFYGPNNMDEWQRPKNYDGWLFQEKALTSQNNGDIIGKDVGMLNSSHISLELSYTQPFQLGVTLHSDSPTSINPQFGCKLTLSPTSSSITLVGEAVPENRREGNASARHRIDSTKRSVVLDIFSNAELGAYYIYIDGKQIAFLQVAPLEINKSRGGISLINSRATPIKVKYISIRPWDSHLPSPNKNDAENTATDHITLNNGDHVPGTVGKVEDDYVLIETEYTPIKIPFDRIRSFNLGNEGEQPVMQGGDVCVWFHEGGHLTLKPTSITEEKVTGYGQAFGNLEIDTSALSRIDFNIYEDSLNSDRAKAN